MKSCYEVASSIVYVLVSLISPPEKAKSKAKTPEMEEGERTEIAEVQTILSVFLRD